MINELKGLNVEEISLVAKPANERRFLLLKQKEGISVPELDNILKSLDEMDVDLENEDVIEKTLKAMKLSEDASKAVKGCLKLLSAHKEQMPEDLMARLAEMAGYSEMSSQKMSKAKEEDERLKSKKPDKEDFKVKPLKKEDGSLDIDNIPEDTRPLVEMLWKEHEDAIKKANDLEAILKNERDIRITKEFNEKGALYPNIGTAEVVGAMIRKAFDVSVEYGKQLENTLKDADTRIEKSKLFQELGSNATSDANTAWAKIEELAKSVVVKGQGKTMAQAIDKVLAENPKLYEEYVKERSGK